MTQAHPPGTKATKIRLIWFGMLPPRAKVLVGEQWYEGNEALPGYPIHKGEGTYRYVVVPNVGTVYWDSAKLTQNWKRTTPASALRGETKPARKPSWRDGTPLDPEFWQATLSGLPYYFKRMFRKRGNRR